MLTPPTSFETKLSSKRRSVVKVISKHYYIFEECGHSSRKAAELLLLVGRLVQAEGYDGDLSPAQWMALRFFARANSVSRTPSAFAEFKRRPVAPHHKPLRRLRQVDIWSDSDPKRTAEA